MAFKVRVFLGDQLIPEDQLKNLVIHNKTIDRIINSAVDRNYSIIDDDEPIEENCAE